MLKMKIKNKFKELKKKITKKHIYNFGIVLLIIGIILFSYDYLYMKILKIFDDMNYKIFLNTDTGVGENSGENINDVDSSQINTSEEGNATAGIYNYIAMLEIPKINLKRGLVAKDSSANRVSVNIQTLKESNYPDVDKGNFILAAHSGNGYNSYFRDLYRLEKKDVVNVYYHDIKYTYEITDIYLQDKIGKLVIYRDRNKTTLTLITCTRNNRTKQSVYIAELVSYVEY